MPNPDPEPDAAYSHLIRAALAIILSLVLPFVLWIGTSTNSDVVQVYLDALAAVVAFYFGASSSPN